jgi:hypothetical protein
LRPELDPDFESSEGEAAAERHLHFIHQFGVKSGAIPAQSQRNRELTDA